MQNKIWQYTRNSFKGWTPQHALFNVATASLFAALLKVFTAMSIGATIFIGLFAFLTIVSAFSTFQRRPERSFESLCDDLIADARFVGDSEEATQWATKVWVALKATPFTSKAVEWDILMTPILDKKKTTSDLLNLVRNGVAWLKATAVSVHLTTQSQSLSKGTLRRVHKMYQQLVDEARQVETLDGAKKWALKASAVLRVSSQTSSLDSFATIVRPLFEKNCTEFQETVQHATAVIEMLAAYSAPDDEDDGDPPTPSLPALSD